MSIFCEFIFDPLRLLLLARSSWGGRMGRLLLERAKGSQVLSMESWLPLARCLSQDSPSWVTSPWPSSDFKIL